MSLENLNCVCPNCSHRFELSEGLENSALDAIKNELLASVTKDKNKELEEVKAKAFKDAKETAMKEAQDALKDELVLKNKLETELTALKARTEAQEATTQDLIETALIRQKQQFEAEKKSEIQESKSQIERLKKDLEKVTTRASQGSMQAQGEAAELVVEDELRSLFPADDVEEVAKGASGADCILTVRERGRVLGKIVFEVKRTSSWMNSWIPKLKINQAELGAEFAVLVTSKYPANQEEASLTDDVWVCGFHEFANITRALREAIKRLAVLRVHEANREDNANEIYDFIQSVEFKLAMEALIKPINKMSEVLDTEKRAMQKSWKARETMIENALENASNVIGRLQGIAPDAELPVIEGSPSFETMLVEHEQKD